MRKRMLACVLVAGLVAATIVTRPTPAGFEAYLRRQIDAGGQPTPFKTDVRGLANNISPDAYLRTVTYRDRLFWTTVELDGHVQYVGAYSHWFRRAN